jgi:predicted secreted protein
MTVAMDEVGAARGLGTYQDDEHRVSVHGHQRGGGWVTVPVVVAFLVPLVTPVALIALLIADSANADAAETQFAPLFAAMRGDLAVPARAAITAARRDAAAGSPGPRLVVRPRAWVEVGADETVRAYAQCFVTLVEADGDESWRTRIHAMAPWQQPRSQAADPAQAPALDAGLATAMRQAVDTAVQLSDGRLTVGPGGTVHGPLAGRQDHGVEAELLRDDGEFLVLRLRLDDRYVGAGVHVVSRSAVQWHPNP